MQYRLSTLFLIFFLVATSLALFGSVGIYIAVVLLIAALCLNRVKNLWFATAYVLFLIFIGIICPGFISLAKHAHEGAKTAACMNNLKQIGLALHNYHDANKHFPPINICDKNGKPLFSWRVQIVPMMEYSALYDSLKKNEPWNSPHNAKLFSQFIPEYLCPWDNINAYDSTTNYVAIIGPGTAWREDGPVKFSDLSEDGSHTVMVVEVGNSGVHWAEPRELMVDEALERMKTGRDHATSADYTDKRRYNIIISTVVGCVLARTRRTVYCSNKTRACKHAPYSLFRLHNLDLQSAYYLHHGQKAAVGRCAF